MYGLLLLINKNPQISTTLPSINIENVFIIPCKFYMFESVSGISQVFCCTYLTMRNVRNIKNVCCNYIQNIWKHNNIRQKGLSLQCK